MKYIKVICGVILAVTLTSCSTAPERSFTTTDLLVDQTTVLDGWKLVEYHEDYPGDEGQEAGSEYIFQNVQTDFFVRTCEKVFRYRNQESAAWQLNRLQKDYMSRSAHVLSDWETPSEFDFEPEFSKNWKFACVTNSNVFQFDNSTTSIDCQYLAQYEEFVIQAGFTKDVDDISFLSMSDIENILTAMDEKFGEYIFTDLVTDVPSTED